MTLETGVKALAEAVAADVKALEDGKVDKELGKGLSETNFTQLEKTKLADIAADATKNRADSENADKVHTHTMSQVTGLDTALSGKAATTDPRFTDAREWSAATIPQAEVEAGTATTRRAFTAQRLRQGITAWFTGISGAIGRTILGRGTAAEVRGDLGLGTAATATLTDSTTNAIQGRVLKVGDFGIATGLVSDEVDLGKYTTGGSYVTPSTGLVDRPTGWPTIRYMMVVDGYQSSYLAQVVTSPSRMAFRHSAGTIIEGTAWSELYHTGNTTKNPDGTLKASSPVINLYTDKHDLHNEEQFGSTPAVVRKSKGVYEITGTLGLRAEGWYLDTPSDRNGNKYFNIEWTQSITPETEDGVVDEYLDNIIVTIETFERVWNKETGLFENGAPIDINDLQDRFVQLRFNELKIEHEELDDETITRNQE